MPFSAANLFMPPTRTTQRVGVTDEELMETVTRGDAAPLRPLVERFHTPLLGFLYRTVSGKQCPKTHAFFGVETGGRFVDDEKLAVQGGAVPVKA